MLPPASLESVALNRLSHARVSWLLARAGLAHLVIKGVGTADLLGTDRASADVDVLLAPADAPRAVAVLCAHGHREPLAGSAPGETALHSRTLRAELGNEVDVHHHFPGLDADPLLAFGVLSARGTQLPVAGHPVPVPDVAGRVLLLAVAAGRDGKGSRAARDFEAALGLVDPGELRRLAEQLAALGPLRAGVWTLPHPEPAEAALELAAVDVPTRWQLMAEGSSSVDLRWQELREAGWGRRLRLLVRELVPTRAFMAGYDPRSAAGWAALTAAHLRRWRVLAAEVPRSARRVRRQTRRDPNG